MIGLSLGLWQYGRSASFSPLSLSPALWLDASDAATLFQSNGGAAAAADGDPVGYVLDKSGSANHLIQVTGTSKPTLKLAIQNAKPVIRFDGVNDFFAIPNFGTTAQTAKTICWAAKTATVGNIYFIASIDKHLISQRSANSQFRATNGIGYAISGTNTGNSFYQATILHSGTNVTRYEGGTQKGTVSMGVSTGAYDQTHWIARGDGASGNTYHAIDFLELLIFPSPLSAENLSAVENYLMVKWGV